MTLLNRVEETVAYIHTKTEMKPETAIVLGSGLGQLGEKLEDAVVIPYEELPHWKSSTAPGHSGRLLFGKLGGKQVVCMQGRLHYYEGYSMEDITYPVRVMAKLGVKNLLLSNAAGGINTDFAPGQLMLITDHINFLGRNPLMGPNEADFGVRFCDMSYAYHPELRRIALEAAEELGQNLAQILKKRGVKLHLNSMVKNVEETAEGSLLVTNITETDIPCIRIFYKFYMYDTNVYVGGITYTAKVTNLAAGASCIVTPSHYLQGYSKIIMVKTYDTEV